MKTTGIAETVNLKPITLDDLASVRYVHKSSFHSIAGIQHTEEEIQAQTDMVYSKTYVDMVLANNTYCAWIGDEIVGTSGWCPANDRNSVARINMIFVHPLFCEMGIGSMLVSDAERRAQAAGFYEFSARANINSVSFYKRHGYYVTSRGIIQTPKKVDLPVAFMRKNNITEKHHIYSQNLSASLHQTA